MNNQKALSMFFLGDQFDNNFSIEVFFFNLKFFVRIKMPKGNETRRPIRVMCVCMAVCSFEYSIRQIRQKHIYFYGSHILL